MAEWDPRGRRVFIEDVRGHDAYLRATWHPDTRVIVISHWQGNVCTASTPIAIGDASQLIGLLVAALEEAATDPSAASEEPPGFTVRSPGGREPSGGAASPCPP